MLDTSRDKDELDSCLPLRNQASKQTSPNVLRYRYMFINLETYINPHTSHEVHISCLAAGVQKQKGSILFIGPGKGF